MKIVTVIILTVFANALIAQDNKINISYSVNLKDNYSSENKLYRTRNIISYSQKQKVFSGFVQKIQQTPGLTSYKLPFNGYEVEFNKISDKNPYLLNNEYVYDVPAGTISVKNGDIYSGNKMLADLVGGEYLSNNIELISNLSTIDFFETWEFNAITGAFTKTVKQMDLCAGDEKKELFGFKTNDYKNNVIVENNASSDNYSFSATDVLIGKISYYVDFKYLEKVDKKSLSDINYDNNSFYHFIHPSKRYKLLNDILRYAYNEQVLKGNQVIFEKSDCSNLLDSIELTGLLRKCDTLMVEDVYNGGYFTKVSCDEKAFNEIQGLVFHETWYYDSKNFSMKKIVHGISLVSSEGRYDYETGEKELILNEILYIGMKNQVNNKNSPFFNKPVCMLSESLYSDGSSIFNISGKNLTEKILVSQVEQSNENPFKNIIGEYFYNNLLKVGLLSKIETYYIEEYDEVGDGSNQKEYPVYSYGLINNRGEIILPLSYPEITDFNNGFAVIAKDTVMHVLYDEGDYQYTSEETQRKYGLIDENGKVVIPCKYSQLQVLNKNLIMVIEDQKQWLINSTGKLVVDTIENYIEYFVNGFAKIKRNGKWGLINSSGKEILGCANTFVSNFNNDRAVVYNPGSFNYINTKGVVTGKAEYGTGQSALYKNKIVYIGEIDDKGIVTNESEELFYGMNDKDGKVILPCIYENITEIGDNRYAVKEIEGNWSIYNESGEKINSYEYSSIGDFINGYATVSVYIQPQEVDYNYDYYYSYKYGFIDTAGNEVVPLIYDELFTLSENIFIVKSAEKYGLVGPGGVEILKIEYGNISRQNNQYASIIKDGKYGFLDNKGTFVSELKYEWIGEVKNGIVPVKLNNKWRLYNLTQKAEIPGEFDYLTFISDDYIKAFNGSTTVSGYPNAGTYGIINMQGMVLLPPIYEKICNIDQGVFRIKQEGKWGYANAEGKILIKPAYQFASDFINDVAYVYKSGKYFSIDRSGKPLEKLEFISGDEMGNGLNRIFVSGMDSYGQPAYSYTDALYGLADEKGKIVLPVGYNNISTFNEDIYRLFIGEVNEYNEPLKGKSGLADKKGKVITKQFYDNITDLNNGYYLVYAGETDNYGYPLKGKYGIIGNNGKEVIPVLYDYISNYNDSVYRVFNGELDEYRYPLKGIFGMISDNGTILLKPEYNYIDGPYIFIGTLDENNFPLEGKYGWMSDNYKILIPPVYDKIREINDTLLLIFKGKTNSYGDMIGKSGLADKNGKIIVQPKYDHIYSEEFPNNPYCRVFVGITSDYGEPAVGKYGILRSDGVEVIAPLYDKIGFYDSYKSLIYVGNTGLDPDNKYKFKYGFINRAGKVVIPFKYDDLTDFQDGLSVVYLGKTDGRGDPVSGKYSIIDTTGKELLPFTYDYIIYDNGVFFAFTGTTSWGWPTKGKYTLLDKTGKKVFAGEYDKISFRSDGFCELYNGELNIYGSPQKGKYGISDMSGNMILPVEYESINKLDDWEYYYLSKDGKWGLADRSYNIIVPPSYDNIGAFYNDLAPAQKNGKWGYIDVSGNTVIDFIYDYAGCFVTCDQNEYYGNNTQPADEAKVYKDKTYFKINKEGKNTGGCEYNTFAESENGEKIIEVGPENCNVYKQYGLMSRNKQIVMPCLFGYLEFTPGGRVIGKLNNKYGFYDIAGKELTPPRYSNIWPENNGMYMVSIDLPGAGSSIKTKYGFADTTGKEIIPCKYDLAEEFRDDKTRVCLEGKYYFINKKGEKISEKEYDYAWGFIEGYAAVYTGKMANDQPAGGKYGFIDAEMKEIVPPVKYDYVDNFSKGYALVFVGQTGKNGKPLSGNYGVIDVNGQEIFKPEFDHAEMIQGQFLKIFSGKTDPEGYPAKGKFGLYNIDGKLMLQPVYDLIIPVKYYESAKLIVFQGSSFDEYTPAEGKYGLFSMEQNKMIIPCTYDWIDYSGQDSLYRVFNGTIKYIDRGEWYPENGTFRLCNEKGDIITKKPYEWMEYLYNERMMVKSNGKFGFIDRSGNEVIPCIYDKAGTFDYYNPENIEVEMNGKVFRIDKNGKTVE